MLQAEVDDWKGVVEAVLAARCRVHTQLGLVKLLKAYLLTASQTSVRFVSQVERRLVFHAYVLNVSIDKCKSLSEFPART